MFIWIYTVGFCRPTEQYYCIGLWRIILNDLLLLYKFFVEWMSDMDVSTPLTFVLDGMRLIKNYDKYAVMQKIIT